MSDRDEAVRVARARAQRQHRGTGHYPVTVGGYVVGHVERVESRVTGNVSWKAFTDDGTPVVNPGIGDNSSLFFGIRRSAVRAVAATDGAVEAYRQAAREGTFGYREQARVSR
jgi:hypothetical protein